MKRRILLAAIAILSIASIAMASPSAPDLEGTWTGTVQLQLSDEAGFYTTTITMEIEDQTSLGVTGEIKFGLERLGPISFSGVLHEDGLVLAGDNFTGVAKLQYSPSGFARMTGYFQISAEVGMFPAAGSFNIHFED